MRKPTKADEIKIKEYGEWLKKQNYQMPSVTADIVALRPAYTDFPDAKEMWKRNQVFALEVLLIRRGAWPYEGMWALPGGFINSHESVEEGARRELQEETTISESRPLIPIGVFSKPGRDMRTWVISNAFVSVYNCGEGDGVKGASDAADAKWFRIGMPSVKDGKFELPFFEDGKAAFTLKGTYRKEGLYGGSVESVEDNPLAFDHAEIIATAFLRMLALDVKELAFYFLPEEFSLTNYIDVYQYFTNASITPTNIPNFRRKITSGKTKAVTALEGKLESAGKGHARAQLFRRLTPEEKAELCC